MKSDEELKEEFLILEPKYSDIAGVLKGVFEDKLGIQNIGYLRVAYRIKLWESVLEKFKRKKYVSLDEMNDICGFRIIVRNYEDRAKIINIIEDEFTVKETQDKDVDLKSDQFGYRSYHIIVSIKESWMAAPQYRGCENLKFEIQIRSELMDAWANISHEIFYKKGDISDSVQRRLYRLSALMEIGDTEIAQLILHQKDIENSRNKLESSFAIIKKTEAKKLRELQSVLDRYLPDRLKVPENPLYKLLEEMEEYKFTFEKLINILETKKAELLQIESEAFSQVKAIKDVESRWWQIGVVRGIMFLTIDDYWVMSGTQYSDHFVSVIEKYRGNFLSDN